MFVVFFALISIATLCTLVFSIYFIVTKHQSYEDEKTSADVSIPEQVSYILEEESHNQFENIDASHSTEQQSYLDLQFSPNLVTSPQETQNTPQTPHTAPVHITEESSQNINDIEDEIDFYNSQIQSLQTTLDTIQYADF